MLKNTDIRAISIPHCLYTRDFCLFANQRFIFCGKIGPKQFPFILFLRWFRARQMRIHIFRCGIQNRPMKIIYNESKSSHKKRYRRVSVLFYSTFGKWGKKHALLFHRKVTKAISFRSRSTQFYSYKN